MVSDSAASLCDGRDMGSCSSTGTSCTLRAPRDNRGAQATGQASPLLYGRHDLARTKEGRAGRRGGGRGQRTHGERPSAAAGSVGFGLRGMTRARDAAGGGRSISVPCAATWRLHRPVSTARRIGPRPPRCPGPATGRGTRETSTSRSPGSLASHAPKSTVAELMRIAWRNAPAESTNTKLRVLHRIAFGFREPEHMVALAHLDRGGCCPPLPGRAARRAAVVGPAGRFTVWRR